MIVFGQNHFKIKSFTHQELKLPREQLGNIDIQVRQRYAHLFWIPFFPIGKIYAFKRPGDSNLYELPPQIKQTIQLKHGDSIRTPWYSYSLILIALLVGCYFIGNEKLRKIKYENNFYQKQAEAKMMVKYPTTGDYYSFNAYTDEKGYEHTPIVLKVNSYDDDTIEFTCGYENPYAQKIYDYQIEKEFSKEAQYIYEPTRISKELLTKMVTRNYKGRNDRYKMAEYDIMYFKFNGMKRKQLEKQ